MSKKLILNYMRPLSVLAFLLVTIAIVASYYLVPKIFALTLTHYYYKYWHLLTISFFITLIFLAFAFYSERKSHEAHWFQHLIAFILIGYFINELIDLIQVGDAFLAFLS